MIVITAIVQSTAADIEAMRDALAEMESASRAEEGCHDYTFLQEVSNPDVLRINERWESMEALQAHFATPHMAKFNEAMGAHPPKSMELSINELGDALQLPS
jgi:quinol monooxygenase YgiN